MTARSLLTFTWAHHFQIYSPIGTRSSDLVLTPKPTKISVRDYSIFRNVLPTDYIIDTFKRKAKEKSEIPNMNRLEDLVNDEMFWVMHEGSSLIMNTHA